MTGFKIIGLVVATTIVFKYAEVYKGSIIQDWANSPAETQLAEYQSHMKNLVLVSYALLALRLTRDFVFDKKKRDIGRNVHKETLTKVLHAPVNTFFDVTPIGKILSIFNGDLEVFYGRILEPLHHMTEMGAHIIVVLSIFYAIGNVYVLLMLCSMAYVMYFITKPYLHADN